MYRLVLHTFFLLGFFILVASTSLFSLSIQNQNLDRILLSPNTLNWFGTDGLGRDLFSRVVYGGRVSLSVGVFASVLALLIGTLYGAIMAHQRGLRERLLMKSLDILQSVPAIVLMILVSVSFNTFDTFESSEAKALFGIVVSLTLVGWVPVARLVRLQVLHVKSLPFIEAATSSGVGGVALFFKHVLPNILSPLVVFLVVQVPTLISFESVLSFLGIGLQPPYSSWGVLANEGWKHYQYYPHLMIFPALMLFLTMFYFNFLADELGRKWNPRTKSS